MAGKLITRTHPYTYAEFGKFSTESNELESGMGSKSEGRTILGLNPSQNVKGPYVACQDSLCTHTFWTCDGGVRWQFQYIISVSTEIITTELAAEAVVGGPDECTRGRSHLTTHIHANELDKLRK